MSSSSLSPSRKKKDSAHKRSCDFGKDHVPTDRYEEKKLDILRLTGEVKTLEARLVQKDAELLQYHNECAALTQVRDALEGKLADLKKELADEEKENAQHIEDYNQLHDKWAAQKDTLSQRTTLVAELRESYAKLQRRTLDVEKEEPSLKRKIVELEEANKRLKTRNDELEEEARQQEKDAEIDALFTPEPSIGPNLETQVRELKQHLQEQATARHAALVERDNTEKLRLEAEQQLSRLRADCQELREEIEEWESAVLNAAGPKKDETPWTAAETELALTKAHQALKHLSQRGDLTPIQALHPTLEGLQTPGALAQGIRDCLSFSLASLWQQLPHEADESLVTPQTQLSSILERVEKAAARLKLQADPEKESLRNKLQLARDLAKQGAQERKRRREIELAFSRLKGTLSTLLNDPEPVPRGSLD